ncbi:hypothetical protein NDU88_002139 [Pleurodeles waltl]|uniref:Uncharacterized protein n=1 Tax=Pleurodeles waltl TaxID=8319 RepID=A0AAV7WNL0_PLEWA|nr:hypothetical protein NDU88_002139 [Pleurodeles waltl]
MGNRHGPGSIKGWNVYAEKTTVAEIGKVDAVFFESFLINIRTHLKKDKKLGSNRLADADLRLAKVLQKPKEAVE